ncbi:hypothetical protein MET9862_02801 [Methylobacterium symbioticum]|uniref:Uncharacterized protein n=1 Tax=Methylobacterium symbioticum TaxID=2584084 RepID=A0A509ED45_9HYPH|nr:hypothetical protein MET9862_02801 [Methylobacterium symbioticum]
MPRPAITACLIVSFEPESMPSFARRMMTPLTNSSNTVRVPEPSSRTKKACSASSAFGMSRRPARGWPGAAIRTRGCGPKVSASIAKSRGGRPMIAKSIS